jgi:phosphate transport system permease protein
MQSVPERLFTAIVRVCALAVASAPITAVLVLCWVGGGAVMAARSLPGASGLASTAGLTLAVAATAAVAGGALGIGCAIAAEEIVPSAVRGAIGGSIGFLGALPSVAFGWFAVVFVAPVAARQPLGGATAYAAASIVLAAMVAPTACALVTRALRRVPDSVRHAAAAAGASRLQTTVLIVVPALRRRIALAVVAAFARAVGEATALQVLFAALALRGSATAATTASWIFSSAVAAPSATTAAQLSFAGLVLVAVAAACAFLVAREYRGMQWA